MRQIINPGQSANLSVTASGSGTITYQWARKGVSLAGATGSTLSVSNATNIDSGWYFVDVTDGTGTTRSAPMFVQVTPAITQALGWGYGYYGQLSFPSDLGNATALAAGDMHSMALHPDGTVTAWGTNLPGPTHGPAGLANVVSIGVGAQFTVALKSDGTVVAWGSNSYHELNIPANLSYVVAIAAGYRHELALRVDGTIAAWGGTDSTAANVPAGLTGVVAIGAGMWHSLAIKNDGTVVAWGTNTYGQTNVPAGLANVIAVAGGGSHSLALKGDGTVVAWGANPWGQCTVPPSLSGVVAISAGMDDSMALKSDGTVVAWGSNYSGYSTLTPRPSNLGQVSAISAGLRYWLALRDASGDAAPAITVQPSSVVSAETTTASLAVTATGAGPITYQWRKDSVNISGATATNFSLADLRLSDAGSYDVVVSNHIGSTTSASITLTVNPVPVVTSLSSARQVLTPGQSLNLGISAVGHGVLSYQWTRNGRAIPGATAASLSLADVTLGDSGWYVVDVTDDYGTRHGAPFFAFVVPTATQVRAWGGAGYEQADLPVGLADVIAISAGGSHSLALKRDGTVVAWGYNGSGQSTVPTGLADVVAISAGADNSVALKSDGTVVAWGQNSFGECDVPIGLNGVVAIAAGDNHTLALKNDGKVVGWGVNFYGSLDIPSGLSGVSAISAGTSFSLALKNDGTVVGWGDNSDGQAGVGSGLTGVRAISAGALHALALLDSGLVVGAGYGAYVQVTPPVGLTGVTGISAGTYHSLAIKSDRTIVAWGNYYVGDSNPPEGLTNVIAVSANVSGGHLFSLALRDASNDAVPNVVLPPVSHVGVEEQAATFTVTASGPGPITYQWRKDGVNLNGANAATLTLANLQLADAGSYDVVVTNYIGSATSAASTLTVTPIPVVTNLSLARIVLSPSQDLNLAVTATGTGPLGFQWTRNGRPISGATNSSFSSTAVTVQDGGCYAVLVTDDIGTRRSDSFFINVVPEFTKVRMWGDNSYGLSTNQVGLNNCIAVEGGTAHALALRRDGSVVGWGYAGYGQSAIPSGLTDVVAIADGNDHSLALKSNGTVVAWGQNYEGQASVPAGLANVVAIAAGDRCSYALKSDGTVSGWGFDSGGQWRVPAGLNNVVSITAGNRHIYAVKKDGTVVAWGQNSYGELPAPAGLSGVVSVVTTTYDSLALKNDGTVVGWGIAISQATNISRGLTNVVAIAGGNNHFMALKRDGTVVAWGQDYLYGQAAVPAGLTGCIGLGAGDNQSLVVRDAASDPEPTITVQPLSQTVLEGNSVTFLSAAIGSPSPSYQWKKNGTDIPGATNSSYTITNTVAGSAGAYTVVATNSAWYATSDVALLTFIVAPGNAVITFTVE